jgi:hypothetical protein
MDSFFSSEFAEERVTKSFATCVSKTIYHGSIQTRINLCSVQEAGTKIVYLQGQSLVLSPLIQLWTLFWLASTTTRKNKRAGVVYCEIQCEVHVAQLLLFCLRQIQNKQLCRFCFL